MPDDTNQPLHAEILREGGDYTTVRLTLLGKHHDHTFRGPEHRVRSAAWVNEWNAHFEAEWLGVRETSAQVMERFIQALRREGVGELTIDEAMRVVKQDAAG